MEKYSHKNIMKILSKNGWIEKRINGGHHIFVKKGNKKLITVSTASRQIPIGTLKNIERHSKLKF